jgi:DNA-binding NarL/FixJ family response regulator
MIQNRSIRILVADDHALFRQGIIRLLHDSRTIIVDGEAENGEELITKYFTLKPDIILVDIAMPVISGIEAVERILEKDPDARALFLSMYDNEDYIYKILKIGGMGLVNKNVRDGELYFAIEKVLNGEKYFSGKWTEENLKQLLNDYEASRGKSYESGAALNFREEQVLKFISKGKKSTEIAAYLNLSKKSVDYYRSNLLHKLGLKTQAELIKYGISYFNKS